MTTVTFKQFKSDFEKYYKEKLIVIKTEDEMEITMSDLYDTDNYEFDWENNIIEIY
jgi:hypothetical protein